MDSLLECEIVELVQKIWRRYVKPELLEKIKDLTDLPNYLVFSLRVNALFSFLH